MEKIILSAVMTESTLCGGAEGGRGGTKQPPHALASGSPPSHTAAKPKSAPTQCAQRMPSSSRRVCVTMEGAGEHDNWTNSGLDADASTSRGSRALDDIAGS
jgi:hypothetical protein